MTAGFDLLTSVLPLPGASAAAVAFRSQGQIQLTVVVKAVFGFAEDAEMALVEPISILRSEVHHHNNPAQSIRFAGDIAPYLGRADILFTGHAYPPSSNPPAALPVRLMVFQREGALLDKKLLVHGAPGQTKIPMVYERAFGGIGHPDNPVGTPEPAIVDPAHPGSPAGLGPISRAWHARRHLLGNLPRKALDVPLMEIPPGFDWSYFQSAPLDQQTDYLRGDEWIVLEGLHPSPRLRTHLPGAQGLARIFGLAGFGVAEGHPLPLHADTLHIDGAEQRCIVVWRQTLPLPDEAALAAVRVAAGVELPGAPLSWPDAAALGSLLPAQAQAPRIAPAAPQSIPIYSVTSPLGWPDTTLATEAEAPPPLAPALPFRPGDGAFLVQPNPAVAVAPHLPTGTLSLEGDPAEPLAAPVVVAPLGASPIAPLAASPIAPLAAPPIAPLIASSPIHPAAPPLSAAMASTAALGAGALLPPDEAPSSIELLPDEDVEESDTAEVLDLLFHDPKFLPRIRRHPEWQPIVDSLQDMPHDPDIDAPDIAPSPVEGEERRQVFEVLARGAPASPSALSAALKGAIREGRRFVAPLVLLAGEVSFEFDATDELKATVLALSPHASAGDALQRALDLAKDALKEPEIWGASALRAHLTSVQEAYGQSKRPVLLAAIKAQVGRALLERRRYHRVVVFGGPHLCARLRMAGGEQTIPLYLPEAMALVLPLRQSIAARLIAEAHLSADEEEAHPVALRVVALARSAPPAHTF